MNDNEKFSVAVRTLTVSSWRDARPSWASTLLLWVEERIPSFYTWQYPPPCVFAFVFYLFHFSSAFLPLWEARPSLPPCSSCDAFSQEAHTHLKKHRTQLLVTQKIKSNLPTAFCRGLSKAVPTPLQSPQIILQFYPTLCARNLRFEWDTPGLTHHTV